MTEASYVAWDDNLYEWPPPDGWYESSDGKWWPEGYGPGQGDGSGSAASALTPESSTPAPSETSSSPGSFAGPGDADAPEGLLGLGLDETSVLPAGEISSFVADAENREATESQRPVYDELPPIDDIFGLAGDDDDDEPGDDEDELAGDSVDDELVGDHPNGHDPDDQHSDDVVVAIGPDDDGAPNEFPPADAAADKPAFGVAGAAVPSAAVSSAAASSDGLFEGDVADDDHPGSGADDVAVPDLALPSLQTESESLERPREAAEEEIQAVDQHEAGLDVVDRGDVAEAGQAPVDADSVYADDAGRHDEPADEDDGDGDRYYEDDEDGYVDDDAQHRQPDADHEEIGDLGVADGADERGAADGDLAAEADAAELTDAGHDRFSAAEATVVADDAVAQAAAGVNAASNPTEATVAVSAETALAGPPTPTVISGEAAARSPIGADLTQTIVGGDDATSIGLDVGYGESIPGEQESDAYEPARMARWPLVVGGLLLLAMAGGIAFLIGNTDDPVASTPETTVVSSGPGSLGEPYALGTGVVVFYDIGGDQNRWVLQVIDPVADLTEDLTTAGVAAPDGNNILAAARVRITFQSGVAAGPVSDLGLDAVAVPDALFPALTDCGPDSLDPAATLEADQSVEATVCWAIPPGQLPGLILGVTAGPADGTVHLALR